MQLLRAVEEVLGRGRDVLDAQELQVAALPQRLCELAAADTPRVIDSQCNMVYTTVIRGRIRPRIRDRRIKLSLTALVRKSWQQQVLLASETLNATWVIGL